MFVSRSIHQAMGMAVRGGRSRTTPALLAALVLASLANPRPSLGQIKVQPTPFPDGRRTNSSQLDASAIAARIRADAARRAAEERARNAAAQSVPPSTDPLMNLLLAQPKIEIVTNVSVSATFEPSVVKPGEEAVYRVSFNALEESIDWPEHLTGPAPLGLRQGAHGEILQSLGATIQPHTTFLYHVRPSATGVFSIPSFQVKVYDEKVTVPAAQLTVEANPSAPTPPLQRLTLDFERTNLFAGESVRTRVSLAGSAPGTIQLLQQVQFTGQGFLVDNSAARQRIEAQPHGGSPTPAFVYDTLLTPLESGVVSVSAQGFTIGNRFYTPNGLQSATMGGAFSLYTLVDSDPVELHVQPLPRQGSLPGFTGAIGDITVDPPSLSSDKVQAGEVVKLAVSVHLPEEVSRIVPPPPPHDKNWQVFSGEVEQGVPAGAVSPRAFRPVQANPGGVTFVYSMIPLTEKVHATPPIPFSAFDPVRKQYVNLTIPSAPIEVQRGPAGTEIAALQQPDADPEEPEKEPVLSDLAAAPGRAVASMMPAQLTAWFTALQFVPALGLIGLVWWDRRRRFLEAHPEVVLRRRAKRALERERRALRKAADAGDAARFAQSAVAALRVACAPHLPAEPGALVGADVLELLPERERANGAADVVRRFFKLTDARRFGLAPAEVGELLNLRPELEKVLTTLEANL